MQFFETADNGPVESIAPRHVTLLDVPQGYSGVLCFALGNLFILWPFFESQSIESECLLLFIYF